EARLERIARHDLVGRTPGELADGLALGPEFPRFFQVRTHDLYERASVRLALDALPLSAHRDLELLFLRERQDCGVAVPRDGLQSSAAAGRYENEGREQTPPRRVHGALGIRIRESCRGPSGSLPVSVTT